MESVVGKKQIKIASIGKCTEERGRDCSQSAPSLHSKPAPLQPT